MSELLTLAVFPQADGYLYSFSAEGRQFIPGGTTPMDKLELMGDLLDHTYYKKLRDAILGTFSESGASTYLRSLGRYGRRLHDEILPSELKEVIKRMNGGDTLHIFADDCTIPWELVKNGGDFWGQLFIISNSRYTGPARVDPLPVLLNVQKIVNVVGCGITPEIALRARKLFQRFQDRAEIKLIDGRDPEATEVFFRHLPSAHLIHFTGHGRLDEDSEVYLQIVEQEDSLANFPVASIDFDLQPGCIIFANACISSKTTTFISQRLGFGPDACANGAGAFIGTLDLVPELEAVVFAEAFYEKLFSGLEIGAALRAVRQYPFRVGGETSLVPLLYSLYGNPYEKARF